MISAPPRISSSVQHSVLAHHAQTDSPCALNAHSMEQIEHLEHSQKCIMHTLQIIHTLLVTETLPVFSLSNTSHSRLI